MWFFWILGVCGILAVVRLPFFRRRPATVPREDWFFTVACLWFTGGLFLDGWAHVNVPQLETFFTPWHAVFYSGYFATSLVLLYRLRMAMKAGLAGREAIDAVDRWSLLGILVFACGAAGDLLWHRLFGVEVNIEALLSPTHLVLAAGMLLIVSREFRRSRTNTLPALISLTMAAGVVLFLTQFGHYTDPEAVLPAPLEEPLVFYKQGLPILGILLFSLLLVGSLSLALRRGEVPFGTVTTVLTALVGSFGIMRGGVELIPAALSAGIVCDFLLAEASAAGTRLPVLRLWSFLLPFLYYALALLILRLTQGVWWTVHVWTGVPFLAGAAGLLMSFIVWPLKARET